MIKVFAIALPVLLLSWPSYSALDAPISEDIPLGDALRVPFTGDLPGIIERRSLLICTTLSAKSVFVLPNGQKHGYEYRLMKEFGDYLNKGRSRKQIQVFVAFVPMNYDRLIPSLLAGYCDVVAAGLTITPERQQLVDFTDPYLTGVKELVVAHKQAKKLSGAEDLSGHEVFVRDSSSYFQSLVRLNQKLKQQGRKPVDIIKADATLAIDDILEMVNAGIKPYTIADSHIAAFWRQVLPDVKVYENIWVRDNGRLAWMVRKSNPKLKAKLNEFVKTHRKGTLKGNIYFKRYLKNTKWITNPVKPEAAARLKRYRKWFEEYSEQYGMDWLLMVAKGFHESGFDQSARSKAGAIGIMQLMPSTAKDERIGIKDIEKPEQNIHAGIKYAALLRNQYFNDPAISPDDQMRFTLAAYNAGPGRVNQMRRLAAKIGYDKNKWFGNCEMAALRLVGQETVRYVRNINKYYVALKVLYELSQKRKKP